MTEHTLKTWPESFWPVHDGAKTAEVRKDDRGYQVGDLLHLREWLTVLKDFSGQEVDVLVTHMERGPAFGIPEGYVVMSIKKVEE